MLVVSSFLVLGTAALGLVPDIPVMFICYAVVGGSVAPILIPSAVLLQRTIDPRVYTQASTWMNSASAAGIAVAALDRASRPARRLAPRVPRHAALTTALPAITMVIRRGVRRR